MNFCVGKLMGIVNSKGGINLIGIVVQKIS